MTGLEVELIHKERREWRLRAALESVRERFMFIVIDAPPSLGLLTVNVLVASDSVLIPVRCEYYALEGLARLLEVIERVQQGLNPELRLEGVLLTMADYRTNLTAQVIGETRSFFKADAFETVIPRSVKLGEAPSFGKPIALYDDRSLGGERYRALASEIMLRDRRTAGVKV
jgi:chromosome partitioning protein